MGRLAYGQTLKGIKMQPRSSPLTRFVQSTTSAGAPYADGPKLTFFGNRNTAAQRRQIGHSCRTQHHQMSLLTIGTIMGSNVPLGLEDSLSSVGESWRGPALNRSTRSGVSFQSSRLILRRRRTSLKCWRCEDRGRDRSCPFSVRHRILPCDRITSSQPAQDAGCDGPLNPPVCWQPAAVGPLHCQDDLAEMGAGFLVPERLGNLV